MHRDPLGEQAGYDLLIPGSLPDPGGTHPEIPENEESKFNVNPDRPIHTRVRNNSPKQSSLTSRILHEETFLLLQLNDDNLDFEEMEYLDILQRLTAIRVGIIKGHFYLGALFHRRSTATMWLNIGRRDGQIGVHSTASNSSRRCRTSSWSS